MFVPERPPIRWLWPAAASFLATRIGVALIAWLAVALVPANTDPAPYHLRGTGNTLVDVFGSRWDCGFYVSIAEEGYRYDAEPFPSVPFFPLLPILMRGLMTVGGDAVIAGLVITNACLLVACVLFYRLVHLEWGAEVARRAVWYMLIFPTSFFGSAIYSESLFLVTAIGALLAARNGRWLLAGACGALAGLSRLTGVLVVPLLLVEWWQQRHAGRIGPLRCAWRSLLATLLPGLGTLGFMTYLWLDFGDPLGFVTGSAAWGRIPRWPFAVVGGMLSDPGSASSNDWLDLAFVAMFAAFGTVLMLRRRWSEGLFVLLGVGLAFHSGLLMSQRRYVWVLFPAFALLARWGCRSWVDRLVTALSLLLLGLFTALFANMYWVA